MIREEQVASFTPGWQVMRRALLHMGGILMERGVLVAAEDVFFLTRDDLSSTLADLNPSLAWLPWLAEVKLLQHSAQLAPWIEKNFDDPDALRDVVANLQFFDAKAAELLESRLNHQGALSSVLLKCWRLVVRHMRGARRGTWPSQWFEVAPRVKRGERSPEVLNRISDALKPALQIGKRIAWEDDRRDLPQVPSDLMSIDYEIEDSLTAEGVLSIWPTDTPPEIDEELLRKLTIALSDALADAIDAGVESNRGFGVSDSDVPSVAAHGRNAYRSGFQTIVRTIAEIWTRLASKDTARARAIVELWRQSSYRLVRRLALFAAVNPVVPPSTVAGILLELPQGELFLTNSTVETYRLLRQRWSDLSAAQREAIEDRIVKGPPADYFRHGTEIERIVDGCLFDLLGELQRAGLELTPKSIALFKEIVARRPGWQLRPAEQAGFHTWGSGVTKVVGDPNTLNGISDGELVASAKRMAAEAGFRGGDPWQALCQSDPLRALRGLEAQAHEHLWSEFAWDPFLWAAEKIKDVESAEKIAQLLLGAPDLLFAKVAASASWWLNESATRLDEALLWPLWDRIAVSVPRNEEAHAG